MEISFYTQIGLTPEGVIGTSMMFGDDEVGKVTFYDRESGLTKAEITNSPEWVEPVGTLIGVGSRPLTKD